MSRINDELKGIATVLDINSIAIDQPPVVPVLQLSSSAANFIELVLPPGGLLSLLELSQSSIILLVVLCSDVWSKRFRSKNVLT